MIHQKSAQIDPTAITFIGKGISRLTFPGFFIQLMITTITCRLLQISVYNVNYFKMFKNNDKTGLVNYEKCCDIKRLVLSICIPFFLCSILAFLVALAAVRNIVIFEYVSAFDYVLLWLGISIASNALSGTKETSEIHYSIKIKIKNGSKILFLIKPLFCLFNVILLLRSLHFEFIFGGFIAFVLPYWIWS